MKIDNKIKNKALSTVELVFAVAFLGLALFAIVSSLVFSIKLLALSRARLGALSILSVEFEKARSMSYSDIGIKDKDPNGILDLHAEKKLNGINYSINRQVVWVDDPKDGLGANDSDSNTHDYKQMKIKIVWRLKGKEYSLSSSSYFSP